MNTQEKILNYIKENGPSSGAEISKFLAISRQAVNKHIKSLIQKGVLSKEGRTKDALFRIGSKPRSIQHFKRVLELAGLEEDRIFQDIKLNLALKRNLTRNVLELNNYVFTEILNNAIEHSHSQKSDIEVCLDQYSVFFSIRDYGIGIFASIYKKFNLADENAAIGELIKGKTTTMRQRHSGEGIFFSSKCADQLHIRSHRIQLVFDNLRRDVFVEEKRYREGTEVRFKISRSSKRNIGDIFRQFAPEDFDYKFEKTKVYVKLFQDGYVSRSEAKRLLSGLHKFKEIILDFKGVKSLGQGFADEVFRVFKRQYPDIILTTQNLSPTLIPIVRHIVDK